MSSAQSLFEAFIIMMICFIVAVVVLFGVALPYDNMEPVFTQAGLGDVSEQWDTFGDRDFLVTLIYLLDIGIMIFGVGNFVVTAVRRQEYDEETIYYE